MIYFASMLSLMDTSNYISCVDRKYLGSLKPFNLHWMSVKQCRPWSDALFGCVWSGSTVFAQAGLSQYP